ncbi:hypothetical protein FQA47_005944 [Oryzias melastigma]|uniref:Uncharacterized protein n=1 Tax=Oryzias melastigma TaxID=30732 RepID=A0A834FR74_ORYME|nr:hypothetical protein FQA47_005944 [Oryzias melastigma]
MFTVSLVSAPFHLSTSPHSLTARQNRISDVDFSAPEERRKKAQTAGPNHLSSSNHPISPSPHNHHLKQAKPQAGSLEESHFLEPTERHNRNPAELHNCSRGTDVQLQLRDLSTPPLTTITANLTT